MIAGPNGSGKTTLTHQLRRDGVDLGNYINPDEIAKKLEGSYEFRVKHAQAMADAERDRCLQNGESFSFETVMSHPSKLEILKRAKSMGFYVIVYFVATETPDLNVARVAQRVALGGHDVPEDRIRARYIRTLSLLPAISEYADDFILFDNTIGLAGSDVAIIKPFCRRLGSEVSLAPPCPNWAMLALKEWGLV